ncbi:MAG: pyrroloquinoline quinone-dependent dehydrogenase, partial [Myxococcota bacterium]
EPWEYYVTSPPIVVGDRVIVGALVADNERSDAPSGVVRAFDVQSGTLEWAWDPVPPTRKGRSSRKPKSGSVAYTPGTANVWSIMSADPERGLVFVPTGNAAPDYFAANRDGLDYYSSSVVALDARTGKVRWFFQTVHHDVWDYDVAPQPTLVDFPVEGAPEPVPAVIQGTKMGHIFVLNRDSGEPLFEVEERPVPQGGVPGETLSPTQPFPTHIPPLHPTRLDPEDAWGFTPWDRARCAETIAGLRSEGLFTPATLEGTIQFPGSGGGMNWGGVPIDPSAGVLFVNQMRMPSVVTLIERDDYETMDRDSVR